MGEFEVTVIAEIEDKELIEFASEEFDINDIYTDEQIIEYVKLNLDPSDVYDDAELAAWAEENGYIREGD